MSLAEVQKAKPKGKKVGKSDMDALAAKMGQGRKK